MYWKIMGLFERLDRVPIAWWSLLHFNPLQKVTVSSISEIGRSNVILRRRIKMNRR